MAMAEGQQKHRQALEQKVIDSSCKAQQSGPIYGFIISMSAIGAGVYLIHSGKDASGIATIITALAGIAGVFFYGKTMQKKQLREQANAIVAPPAPQPPKSN